MTNNPFSIFNSQWTLSASRRGTIENLKSGKRNPLRQGFRLRRGYGGQVGGQEAELRIEH
jgi:hypothetical protein